jgi:thymidylate synthase ThyX
MIENYEEFSETQRNILSRYVTNTTSNIFALKNLPEVIKGALFSKYSRSGLGLRSLLLKEFINSEEIAFASIVGDSSKEDQNLEEQKGAIRKAQNFYDRILDGYGDDSIGELGGAHLALENISMLAAKAIEDCRIGGSPLEKSTRYIYFDRKDQQDEYLFYREPILMTSAYRDLYVKTCNHLFETYSKLIPPMTELMKKKTPRAPGTSDAAYNAALRAKVLDCLRGLLPASSLTNMGVYGNGRFFEGLIQKCNCARSRELEDLGKKAYQELSQVIPSFVRRAEPSHKHQIGFSVFTRQVEDELGTIARQHAVCVDQLTHLGVKLVGYTPDSPYHVAAALLFSHTDVGLHELREYCRGLSDDALGQILEGASQFRENRRHKSPRALECAMFTFEIVADFGIYRDLQRHRMLTQDRQVLTCNLGYYTPEEILDTPMEEEYVKAMEIAKEAYDTISKELPGEAQYVVPMAYNIRWYFNMSLRSLQWLCELRSAPAGHPGYRYIAQELAKQVSSAVPPFERFFKYVDYGGYTLGRLDQEIRKDQKQKQIKELI